MRIFVERCSTSTTEPPSTPVKYLSSHPSSPASFSSKPLSSDERVSSDGKNEAVTELPANELVDFPGAWWTGSRTNDASGTYVTLFGSCFVNMMPWVVGNELYKISSK